ncbi:hypothetical protein [Bacillus sp. T33-2]|uniref:hypothetical protein n=1 Tax=Bacillus sp. T33-2 TaxID=2054168 RepID=UPI00115A711E|nr:hypothetical protein [Bacillus sp. T33-2]
MDQIKQNFNEYLVGNESMNRNPLLDCKVTSVHTQQKQDLLPTSLVKLDQGRINAFLLNSDGKYN